MVHWALIVLHLLIGLSGVGAGLALALKPGGDALGFPVAWLRGSPFPDYRFPGLFLAIVIGGANLVSAAGLLRRTIWAPSASFATGLLLLAWITIQWAIIRYRHWTQVLWVAVFSLTTVLAGLTLRRDRLACRRTGTERT